jgi:hypothetical protein
VTGHRPWVKVAGPQIELIRIFLSPFLFLRKQRKKDKKRKTREGKETKKEHTKPPTEQAKKQWFC